MNCKRILILAAALAVGIAQAGWLYDGSGSTKLLTETNPPGGGTPWILKCTASGTSLTVTGVQQVGDGTVLDLSAPVADSSDEPYVIVGIGISAFKSRTTITKVIYPDTLRTIGNDAFSGCSSINLILPALVPDFVTSFSTGSGRGTYEGCTSITQDFRIGYSPITTGGGQWMARCTGIKRADIGPYITTIPQYCFEAAAVKDLHLSEGLVTFNGGGEFNAVTNVSPAFPLTLKTLNMSFRSSSLVLPEVRLDNVTTLGGNFSSSTVRKIWFGPGIKSFPAYLFERYNHVTNITICATNAITSIGTSAFAALGEMEEFTFMGPAQTESILNTLFANVTTLKPIVRVSKSQGGWTSLNGLERDLTVIRSTLGSNASQYEHILSRDDFIGLYTATGGKRVWMVNSKSIYDPDVIDVAKTMTVSVVPVGMAIVDPPVGTYECAGGDTIPVSAPLYASNGTDCYICTGWVLEHLVSGSWTEDTHGAGNATDLLIPSDENEEYRLRWTYAVADNVKCLTLMHYGTENVTFSAQSLVSSGFKHWYATGTSVTLTAYGDDTIPRSTFVDWTANDAAVSGNTYTWNGTSDLTLIPNYTRNWLYDANAKTITDRSSTLKVTASGTALTISTGHSAVGSILDFSAPITDTEGNPYTLVGIAASAFYGKTSITKVVYPDTLRTIGGDAFSGCNKLALVLPALVPDYITSFNASGRGVYENCTSITQDFSIGFSPITTGGGQWIRNTKVPRADFGPYIKTIPSFVFESTDLKDLRLSEGLVTFNDGSNSGSLTNVTPAFPLTLKTLNQTFRSSSLVLPEVRLDNVTTFNCNFSSTTVRKIWFGPGITKFPSWVFERGNHVTNITICATNAITSIGSSAFASLGEMQEFTFMGPAQTESILNTIFANVTDLRPVAYVSRHQGGWESLSNLVTDREEIASMLTAAQKTTYADRLSNGKLIGLYKVNGSASKRVWMIRRNSIYDKPVGTVVILR
jgi:hypothetical protein